MKARRLFLSLCLLLAVARPAQSQSSDTSAGAQTGRPRFSSQQGGDIDSINVFNGNLSIAIPLFSIPGRELSAGLSVNYNSQKWEFFDAVSQQVHRYTGGWRGWDLIPDTPVFWPQFIGCQAGVDYWIWHAGWRDGLGTKHFFDSPINIPVQQCNSNETPASSEPSVFNRIFGEVTGDGSILSTGATHLQDSLRFNNGTVIEFTSPPAIRTPNGNHLVRNPDGLPVQDTLERLIVFETDWAAGVTSFYRKYKITDSSGALRTYTLNFENGHTVCNPLSQQSKVVDERLVSIVLPGNHGTYSFEYTADGGHGYLTRLKLPSQGYISYSYAPTACTIPGDDHVVTRSVSYDGSTIGSIWTYTRAGSFTGREVTITNTEAGVEIHREVHLFDHFQRPSTVWFKKSDGTVLKTIVTNWDDASGTPSSTVTTIDGLNQKKTTIFSDRKNISLEQDTDWYASGSGTTLSSIFSIWLEDGGGVERLLRRDVSGINPDTGQLELQGKTEYFYDQYDFESGQIHTNVPNHNGNTSKDLRGNLTTVKAYKNATSVVETHFKYDNLGNLVKTIDPLGREETTDFTDNFIGESSHGSFAYPKSVTSAVGTVTTAYNYDTGLAMKVTDLRGQDTTMVYDALNRLKTVTEPNNQRVTENVYDDATPKIHTDVKVDVGKWRRSEVIFDKQGRAVKAVRIDPAGDVNVDTEYDGNGRVRRVSQPYRTGETKVWTTTTYDVLGRPKTIVFPDGISQASIDYQAIGGAQTVTETDEALNPRRMSFNGIGQMVKVEEANPNLATPLVTQYSYDRSGALRKVVQADQTRTFTLDWLGHMSSEFHPESGTTNYQYYADGQLEWRTDARGADYKATFGYDNAGRLKTINYADTTPDVTYDYDTNHIGDGNNYTGFLTRVITGSVTTSTFAYNSAGYQTSEQTQMTVNGVSGSFTTGYGYDMDGRLTSIQYPSGRTVMRSYQFNGDTAADRLLSMTDDKTSATLLGSVSDNAAGQVTSRTLGGVAIEGRDFNYRNQLTRITANSGGTSLMDLTYGYGSGNNGQIRSRTDARQPEHSVSYTFDQRQLELPANDN